MKWFNASKDNAGAASAVCLLTAQKLRLCLPGNCPVPPPTGFSVAHAASPSCQLYVLVGYCFLGPCFSFNTYSIFVRVNTYSYT